MNYELPRFWQSNRNLSKMAILRNKQKNLSKSLFIYFSKQEKLGGDQKARNSVGPTLFVLFHRRRMEILYKAGADILLIETQPSLYEALIEAEIAEELGTDYAISFSCRDQRHTCRGELIKECAKILSKDHPHLCMLGVNCTKPEYVTSLITELKKGTSLPIVVYPNSGEILILNFNQIPVVIILIFKSAFSPVSAVGGFAGATVRDALQYGVARGIYSNDVGTGYGMIAHASAKTDHPVRRFCNFRQITVEILIQLPYTVMLLLLKTSYIVLYRRSLLYIFFFCNLINR